MDTAPDLPGFDPADPSTWHPMNGAVVDALRTVAPMLGIPLGTNLAPAAEHIARTVRPPGDDELALAYYPYRYATVTSDDIDDIGPGTDWADVCASAITGCPSAHEESR